MTKERELLRRAFTGVKWGFGFAENRRAFVRDVEAYLSNPSDDADEPVGYAVKMIPRGLHFIGFVGEEETEEEIEDYGPDQIVPLYTRPEPEAKPVLYIKEQELLYIQVLKQEGLAQEWKSNLGFVKEDGDVGLYLHPPKPAEPARKPMTSEEMEKQYEIDKEYFGESVMRAFYNGIRFAEKHHDIGGDDE